MSAFSEALRIAPEAVGADGIVHREMYPQVPPKTEYSLTELGQALVPLIKGMCEWGYAYFDLAGVPAPCEGVNLFAEGPSRS